MRSYLRSFLDRRTFWQLIRLGVVGTLNTAVYFALLTFFLVPVDLSARWAITLSWILSTALSYVLNRRWTFSLANSRGPWGETAAFFLTSLAAWAATILIFEVFDWRYGPLNDIETILVNLLAAAIILLPKFAMYRDVIFRTALQRESDSEPVV